MRDLAGALRDVCLTNGLEGIYPLRILLPDLHDLSETALANDLEQIELLYCQGLMPRRLEVDFEVERAVPGRGRVPLVRGPLRETRMSADTYRSSVRALTVPSRDGDRSTLAINRSLPMSPWPGTHCAVRR